MLVAPKTPINNVSCTRGKLYKLVKESTPVLVLTFYIEIKLKGVGIDDEWLLNDTASKPI